MNVAKICTINANQVGNFEATPGQQSDKMSHGKNKQSRLGSLHKLRLHLGVGRWSEKY